ncbi:unnamed protein product [Danaus chrysippus]|uniref:(African queen) hypothetical protein n=1 Tax=Danaus chrysippus TaxID=151541 RepID=A0A8J2QA09_9NEOP|nr:unnamed protein product [Danaus chrysippus]
MFLKFLFVFLVLSVAVRSQFYENKRCRCICPTPASVSLNNSSKSDRTLYIAYVPPSKCNCDGVILPKVTDEIKDNAQMFCPRCDCRYETRNTTIIMVVVILVVWMVMLLVGYYIFLVFLEFLISRKQTQHNQNKGDMEEVNKFFNDKWLTIYLY